MRTIEFFENHNNKKNTNDDLIEIQSLIKAKSNFSAPKSSDKNFENQIDYLLNLPLEKLTARKTSNLNKKEWFALKSLMNDKEIVIKKADKGGADVIMSASHYEKMVYSQIHNKRTYKK